MTKGSSAPRRVVSIDEAAFRPFDRYGKPIPKIEWLPISYDEETGQGTFLIRFEAGGRSLPHEHTGFEEFLVLEGELKDDDGTVFRKGDFVTFAPGSCHHSVSEKGCLLAVFMRGPNRLLDEA